MACQNSSRSLALSSLRTNQDPQPCCGFRIAGKGKAGEDETSAYTQGAGLMNSLILFFQSSIVCVFSLSLSRPGQLVPGSSSVS